jgi:sulfur carrier protein ThiS adenylyltransferase
VAVTDTLASLTDRDVRQRELLPPGRLAACHAVVVGVGAVGRQVALQLAAAGVAALDLVDHDLVGVENLAPQGYWPADLGRPKVQSTGELCLSLNPGLELACHAERFRRSSPRTLGCFRSSGREIVLFACVDSIVARRLVWEAVREHARFFGDGRMAAEVVRVLASGRPSSDDYYATTLFSPSQAYAGSCTARSTIYAASVAAGLMVGQWAKWLRGLPIERDLTLNLLSAELTAT